MLAMLSPHVLPAHTKLSVRLVHVEPTMLSTVLVLLVLNTIMMVALLSAVMRTGRARSPRWREGPGHGGVKACSAIDPVSDPAYNMREMAKQSVLLEEHLVEHNKFCPDCITKHFLHIIGLAEEAHMLACDRAGQYPLLVDSAPFYRALFEEWMRDRKGSAPHIASRLREHRKRLIAVYFLNRWPPPLL
jgi:hypothetical protein